MRKQPYTEKGIRRLKCVRCGEKARFQWSICADGNVSRPLCARCDVELNTMVMRWAFGDTREADIAAYRNKVTPNVQPAPRKKPVRVTNKLVAAMREARANGMTQLAIAAHFNISAWCVRFHTSDANRKKMLEYEKARYERERQDPAKVEARRKKALDYYREHRARARPLSTIAGDADRH